MPPDAGAPRSTGGLLDGVTIFAGLTPAMRADVEAATDVVGVAAGEWLFRQGDPGDALFIVRTGRLEVVIETPPPAVVIDVVGPGDALGELALLSGGVRTASLRALRESELLRLQRTAFEQLLAADAAFAAALTRALARQLERRVPARVDRARRVAVVTLAALSPGPHVAVVASELLGQLQAMGPTEEMVPGDGPGDDAGSFGRQLDRLEQKHETVLLVDSPTSDGEPPGEWSRFCRRQADRIVALVDPRQAPPSTVDPRLAGCDVAFWGHPDHAAQIRPWLDVLAARSHHFVDRRGAHRTDVGRLARRVTGRSLGVVLSGGGARGFAHIGALAALLDAGYRVDRVGGTSMGSLVGSLFALGADPAEIWERCRVELAMRNQFNDYRVPRHSLIKGRKAADMLRRLFGSAQLETTTRNMFTVSADLVTAEEVVHRRGSVVMAVGTSMSLPGLVAPVPAGPRFLVDGGVLNNLPVDVMAAAGEGPIVAIDVRSTRFGAPTQAGVVERPSLVETLARSSVLGSWTKADGCRALAAMVVSPDLAGVGLLDFKQIDRIVSEGRRTTELALKQAPLPSGPWGS